jgi:hypothetical protein
MDSDSNVKKLGSTLLFSQRPIRHMLLEIPIDIHTNSSFLFSPLSSLFSFFPLFFLSVFVWAPLLLRHLGFGCERRACKQDLQFRSTCTLTDTLTDTVLFSGGE